LEADAAGFDNLFTKLETERKSSFGGLTEEEFQQVSGSDFGSSETSVSPVEIPDQQSMHDLPSFLKEAKEDLRKGMFFRKARKRFRNDGRPNSPSRRARNSVECFPLIS
jgi:hypothetical protein